MQYICCIRIQSSIERDSPRLFQDNSAKNDTFRIFCAKLYTLLSLDSSTNRCNEIIFWGDTINIKYQLISVAFGWTLLKFGQIKAMYSSVTCTIPPINNSKSSSKQAKRGAPTSETIFIAAALFLRFLSTSFIRIYNALASTAPPLTISERHCILCIRHG